jgi:hypothetical protein
MKAAILRQSVSLPAPLARRIKELKKVKHTSASRVITELIEAGLNAQEQERRRFFDLAERLARSNKPAEQKQLKEELARLTFGG